MFCQLYYIPFYFGSFKDYSPIITDVALLPLTGTMLPTSVVAGKFMSKFGRYRWAIWLGWVTAIAGTDSHPSERRHSDLYLGTGAPCSWSR